MKIRAILNPRAGVAAERERDALLGGPWPELDLIETRARRAVSIFLRGVQKTP